MTKNRIKVVSALGAIILGFGLMVFSAVPASAGGDGGHDPVTICHNGHTITVDDDGSLQGHIHHPGDSIGACQPTPTETVTATETATVKVTVTARPTATVTATETATVKVPGPETTVTETARVDVPGPTVTQTVTTPAETVTATAYATETQRVEVPGPTQTQTVTAPAETVTAPAETVTATATATTEVIKEVFEPCKNNAGLLAFTGNDPTLGWVGAGLMALGTLFLFLAYRGKLYRGAHEA